MRRFQLRLMTGVLAGAIYADKAVTLPNSDPFYPKTLTCFELDGWGVAYIWSDTLSWREE